MTLKWNLPGVPHKGWRCVDCLDLGEDDNSADIFETCEMCGQESIRYVHIMRHPDYSRDLRVGCVCAGKMSDDYISAKNRERHLRNRANRRVKWLSRRWRISVKGNPFLNVKGNNIVIFRKNGGWGCRFNMEYSETIFPTEKEAKMWLFNRLNREGEDE